MNILKNMNRNFLVQKNIFSRKTNEFHLKSYFQGDQIFLTDIFDLSSLIHGGYTKRKNTEPINNTVCSV